jgi:hypothetical protein
MSNTPKAPKVSKLAALLNPDASRGDKNAQVIPLDSDTNVILTKYGAFKQHLEPKVHEQIIKLKKPTGLREDPTLTCYFHNKDSNWRGEMPMTPTLWDFFGEDDVRYVLAVQKPDNQMEILCGVRDPGW